MITNGTCTSLRRAAPLDSLLLEGLVGWLECGHVLELHGLPSEPVLAIAQLDHLVDGVPHRGIVLHHHGLHGLDQTTLDVTWEGENSSKP